MRDALAAAVRERELVDRVHLLGRVPEETLPQLYRAADLFVLPTESLEGFGLVTIEALASGTPVVATPVGATPEILEQLDKDLIGAGTSSQAIASGIRRFLERSASTRAELAQRGRELCERRYGWERVTEAYNRMVLEAA